LLDDIHLPEDATLLITLVDDAFDRYTLGDHLIAGLQDVLARRSTEITTEEELRTHLDAIFTEA
jgi:hypothetical protein